MRMLLRSLAVVGFVACGGAKPPAPVTAETLTPASAPRDPLLDQLLASPLPLEAEPSLQNECAGAPTLGALVAKVRADHPTWVVTTRCDDGECSATFANPEAAPACEDPCAADCVGAARGFAVIYWLKDGHVLADNLECWWS